MYRLLKLPGLIHMFLSVPVIWWIYAGLTGGLGVDPLKRLIDQSGVVCVWVLAVSLSLTPLQRLFRRKRSFSVLKSKARAVGVAAFWYGSLHLGLHILYEGGFAWITDTLVKPFIYLGLSAWILLLILSLTSFRRIKLWIGQRWWKRLHRTAYLIGILAIVHYGMAGKGNWGEAWIPAAVVSMLRVAAWGAGVFGKKSTKKPSTYRRLI